MAESIIHDSRNSDTLCNYINYIDGKTALHVATEKGAVQVVTNLLPRMNRTAIQSRYMSLTVAEVTMKQQQHVAVYKEIADHIHKRIQELDYLPQIMQA